MKWPDQHRARSEAHALQLLHQFKGFRLENDGFARRCAQSADEACQIDSSGLASTTRMAARAQLSTERPVHVLRHTFCSHLAMKGAPARAIQELAGHQDLATTQRYMHLSPNATDAAISLLNVTGDTAETGNLAQL
jgi:integrase